MLMKRRRSSRRKGEISKRMKASPILGSSFSAASYNSSKPPHLLVFNSRGGSISSSHSISSSSSSGWKCQYLGLRLRHHSPPRNSRILCTSAIAAVEEALQKSPDSISSSSPKIDKSGRFCSPRAARELALLIAYASCLEGSDPVRLFEKRISTRREPGYEFDKSCLTEYNHMSFGGPPVTADTVEEADELLCTDEKESAIEAEVLSAPPKLVYSKLILRFTRKLLVAVGDKWDAHVIVIDKIVPFTWKNEPAGRILELCILHLAMSEITELGTRHQIVINEAVDLAKRFCDGAAPRIINGCLRTFVKNIQGPTTTGVVPHSLEAQQSTDCIN